MFQIAHHRDWVVVAGGWSSVSTGLGGVGCDPYISVLSVLLVEGGSTAAQQDEQKVENGLDNEACSAVHT